MFTTAKVVISWDCNLSCDYCCNKYPEIRDSFQPITLEELSKTTYTDYELTGGEPLLDIERLRKVIQVLPFQSSRYIYTNGILLDTQKAYCLNLYIKGINIGYHGIPLNWEELVNIHRYCIPLRLWIQDIDLTQFLLDLNIPIKLWTKDKQCFNINTDRFVLVGDV